jgi:hypothetical protein
MEFESHFPFAIRHLKFSLVARGEANRKSAIINRKFKWF